MSAAGHDKGRSGLELCDRAFHLAREVPWHVLARYYIGSVPFIVGVLTFWAAMQQSAYAERDLPLAALGLAALFVWMKVWQNRYCRGLMAHLRGVESERLGMSGAFRVAGTQAFLHALGLVALPFSMATIFPFAWIYATMQNISVLDDGAPESARGLVGRSIKEAMRWPYQNHIAIWLLSPCLLLLVAALYLALEPLVNMLDFLPVNAAFAAIAGITTLSLLPLNPFGVAVAVNIGMGIFFGAGLLRSFFDLPSLLTDAPSAAYNNSFIAIVVGLSYLCLDPLMKAAYVLRCFEGHALHTGEDIEVRLRRVSSGLSRAGALAVLAGLAFLAAPPAYTGEDGTAAPSVTTPVDPGRLDRALDNELAKSRYTWRMPRVVNIEGHFKDMGLLGDALQTISDTLSRAKKKIDGWMKKLFDWLDRHAKDSGSGSNWSGIPLSGLMPYLLIALVALLAIALGLFLLRVWSVRRKRERRLAAASVSAAPAPDIADEGISADALPEDGWLAMARELFEKGEARLAIRALFLAILARLAHDGQIRIARHKSNREYRLELARRAHVNPALGPAFSSSIGVFEGVWYGGHDAAPPELRDEMLRALEQCRGISGGTPGDAAHA